MGKMASKWTGYVLLVCHFTASFLNGGQAGTVNNKSGPDQIAQINGLGQLEHQLNTDLEKINAPAKPWIVCPSSEHTDRLEVAIIGGGMAGITAGFALIKEGITNIRIFDENPPGLEGPWMRSARMHALRSGKTYMGPALGLPSLTFWSWYEAQYGRESWESLKTIPKEMWNDYLCWYRQVLNLPIANSMHLMRLNPCEEAFELIFKDGQDEHAIYARRVVLATGREGAGGMEIPEFMQHVSRTVYAHTGESIDPARFANKRIAVIGAGPSAFDAAAVALENGAESVEMIVRRSEIPRVSKFAQLSYPGMAKGYYYLPDSVRFELFLDAAEAGIPPPVASIKRLQGYHQFRLHLNHPICEIWDNGEQIFIRTPQKRLACDFVVLATGYKVDLSCRPELIAIKDDILLWKHCISDHYLQQRPKLGLFPYLGFHFQLMEKEPGAAPFLKRIYCFNYGAFLSHGLLTGDIPGISIGASRLAEGIVRDIFLEKQIEYIEKIKQFQECLFDPVLIEAFEKAYQKP
ncbi:NAD(P)-binding domain-containing protein [Candidatus Protochlamydia phocaeensis]|uniref:NAD(P)-binding domain-containing protein n=1 Tax=Candidatus Protochlamydia phocaeensis TaxID=1414722 RepID=UPI0008390014|nr:NAD(P)/FAD-dependent oxidoreductase [Candidatus Protochlamydia phocaeensis]